MNIDTLSIARELRAAELPREQAEAIAAAIGRSVVEGSAKKVDLDLMKADLKAEISNHKVESKADFAFIRTEMEKLRTEIEKGRNQIMTWVIGAVLAVGGTIIAVIKL